MTGLHNILVAVPMLGRGHLAQPLATSIRATADAPILFLCSPGDISTIKACQATGEQTEIMGWEPDRGDYALKINWAYRNTIEPWIFCGASDLVFHEGWDQHALRVGERTRAGVVGTQDTANPLVKRGKQSTHPLVRREYVQEFGSATFDSTGEIYCPLYDHQYIDLELVETAKLRGRWAFAKNSVVEHRHPHWGTAPDDPTYEKAMRQVTQDRELYVARMKKQQNWLARQHKHATL